MSDQSPIRRLIHEMHRRSLWQVLLIYLGASWAVFEAVSGVVEQAGLPDWLPSLALILLMIGFPIVLATAYVQEGVGPREGSEGPGPRAVTEVPDRSGSKAGDAAVAGLADRAPEEGKIPPPSTAQRLLTWRNALGGGVLAFALWGVIATGLLVSGADRRESRLDAEGTASLKSIAVLPFDNLSADQDNAFFADGIHEDVLTQLSKIADLTVISRTSVLAYRDTVRPSTPCGDTPRRR